MINQSRRHSALWLFLIGLGSMTQIHVVGSIGISELAIFLIAPFVFIKDYRILKSDGFMPFLGLSLLTCMGCIVSSCANKTPLIFALKGFAHPYAIFAVTVLIHRLLRNDFYAFKWCLLGSFLTNIVSVFVFRPDTYTVSAGGRLEGNEATAHMMTNPLFWTGRIKQALLLPFQMFYLKVPILCTMFCIFVTVGVALMFSHGSGRAQAIVSFLTFLFILIGGKARRQMKQIGKNFIFVILVMAVALVAFKSVYAYAAKNGILGVEAQQKYYRQTREGTSILRILMAGRMEFFCGVGACLHHPLLGFGPKGEDREGYVETYLNEYGSSEDYSNFVQDIANRRKRGESVYIAIPAHSHIAMFWIYYGIIGLILWLYVYYLMFKAINGWISAVPQWYGFMAFGISSAFWDILFNPFSNRIGMPLLVSCILFSKMVVEKKMFLPVDMEMEAQKYGR